MTEREKYKDTKGDLLKGRSPLIIGVNGVAGSGKDTLTDIVITSLQDYAGYTCEKLAFACNLKAAASIIFDVPLDHFNDRSVKEVVIPFWGMSPREMAQQLGTDACRRGIRDDIWIMSLKARVESSDADIIFITDVRFDNEAQFVRDMGGVLINITYKDIIPIKTSNHASEQGVHDDLIDERLFNKNMNPLVAASQLQNIILAAMGVENGE